MIYGLWELRSGNLLATFDSEMDAARAAGELLAAYGRDLAQDLEITTESPEGEVTTLVTGEALERLVQPLEASAEPGPVRRS